MTASTASALNSRLTTATSPNCIALCLFFSPHSSFFSAILKLLAASLSFVVQMRKSGRFSNFVTALNTVSDKSSSSCLLFFLILSSWRMLAIENFFCSLFRNPRGSSPVFSFAFSHFLFNLPIKETSFLL
ncbi:hypothetical protein MHBO_000676 [Bonamia ostreae]|uniref:Uncharacterized protein n=1 Tax=Bonamia ostreae TaxID=126728 RepID=A0ABV2AGH3_9EUKA